MPGQRKKNKKQIAVWLSPDERDQLRQAAELRGHGNVSQFIRDVITDATSSMLQEVPAAYKTKPHST